MTEPRGTREAEAGPRPHRVVGLWDGESIRFVAPESIAWIASKGHQLEVRTSDGLVFQARHRISTLARRLDPDIFLRIHRSCVVNLLHVREVKAWFGGDYLVFMKDGQQLRLSRTFKGELYSRLLVE